VQSDPAAEPATPPAIHDSERQRSGERWPTSLRLLVAALIVLRVLSALVALGVTDAETSNPLGGGDIRRYEQIAGIEGQPWGDGAVEYPLVSVALIELVTVDDTATTEALVVLASLVFDLAAAAALFWGFGRRTGTAYLLIGLPFAAFPFVLWRIDLLSVALTALALAMLARRRETGGGAVLALGALAKLWPVVLGGWLLVERRWRGLTAALGVGIVGLAAWTAIGGAAGVSQVVSFRGATGWQVESLPGMLHHVVAPESFRFEAGALRTGVSPGWARLALPALALVTVALAWLWAWIRLARLEAEGTVPSDERWLILGRAGTAAVTAMLVFAPIYSPQYAAWLLVPAAIAAASGDRTTGWLTAAIVATSTIGYQAIGGQIDRELLAVGPVLVRNALTVALLCVTMSRLVPDARLDDVASVEGDDDARRATLAPGGQPG
jgi:hypothetical protein